MKRFVLTCLTALLSFFGSSLNAAPNNLLPNLQLEFTPPPLGDLGAVSFMGELGTKNLRGSGTYGVYFTKCQRFKFSGEFLAQKLKYHFTSNRERKWVTQYALGAEYEYLLPHTLFQSIDLGGSYSHSFNRHIKKDRKEIVGSDGGYGYFGTTISLWKCAFLSGYANYDHVKYHRHFQPKKQANGWGGSANFAQTFGKDFVLDLDAEFRKPFNFYEGSISWSPSYSTWDFNCGLYTNYTDGKKGVPNVLAGGIQIGFSFGPNKTKCCRSPREGAPSTKSERCYSDLYCNLANWVATPAVYLPVVLNVTDEAAPVVVTAAVPCDPPTSTPISNIIAPPAPFTILTSSHFSGSSPLTFSATGLRVGDSINSSTGVIAIGTTVTSTFQITVTVTNSCGSTSQSFLLESGG